jgi:hypothetical protein
MRSMRSMRGGFIFRNRGPSLKVHHCQHLASVTKHDTSLGLFAELLFMENDASHCGTSTL